MKKIIPILIIVVAIIFGLHIRAEKFRTYVDPAGEFSFEYPRELVAATIPGDENGVSFTDTPGGPFLISVHTLSSADFSREACLYTENPDNDPGIQRFVIERNGRAVMVTSRGVDAEHLRHSFRFIASTSQETSAFSQKARGVDWRGKLKSMFQQ